MSFFKRLPSFWRTDIPQTSDPYSIIGIMIVMKILRQRFSLRKEMREIRFFMMKFTFWTIWLICLVQLRSLEIIKQDIWCYRFFEKMNRNWPNQISNMRQQNCRYLKQTKLKTESDQMRRTMHLFQKVSTSSKRWALINGSNIPKTDNTKYPVTLAGPNI